MTHLNFSEKILAWFDQHGRKNLPWQKMIHPYRVWISEIMLQQTQVKTVIPYFERFMSHFPDVDSLANAKEEEVLTLWAGLGYYARARNLHKAAKLIQSDFNSQFPMDLETLQTLPGVGRSTAGAIFSISWNQKASILDGNVKRVLTRFCGIEAWPGETKTLEKLWNIAEEYTPESRTGDYTQAIMDLGATVCTRNPNCLICPLNESCIAYQTSNPQLYPGKKPKKSLPHKTTTLLILKDHDHVLLKKREPIGIWGGLWSFPESEPIDNIPAFIQQEFNYPVKNFKTLPTFKHTFSHFHLHITPLLIHVERTTNTIMENQNYLWYNFFDADLAVPTPIKKILHLLRENPQ